MGNTQDLLNIYQLMFSHLNILIEIFQIGEGAREKKLTRQNIRNTVSVPKFASQLTRNQLFPNFKYSTNFSKKKKWKSYTSELGLQYCNATPQH
jgi:hypothetical protein